MKLIQFLCIIGILCTSCNSNNLPYTNAMLQLDEVIINNDAVVHKIQVLDSLKKLLNKTKTMNETYSIQQKIISEYMWFKSDSAFYYVNKNNQIAVELKSEYKQQQSQIIHSILLSSTGLLNESSQLLNAIDREKLDNTLLRDYYYAQERFYYVSSEISHDNYYAPLYKQKEHQYKDSVRSTYPYGSIEYNKYTANLLVYNEKYIAAKELLLQTIPKIKKPTRFAAMIYYDLAEIYKVLENEEEFAHYLTLASITDREVPTKENAAIKELAFYLYKRHPNQLDRANRYIQVALEDARFFNNRQRILQISEKLPLIVNAFQEMRGRENNKLKNALLLISFLLLIIVIMLIFLNRKVKQLHLAKSKTNQLYQELQHTNNAIIQVNSKLSDANETREEYLGIFMDLCASYISKLDDYKEYVNHKIINNKSQEILKNINSQQFASSDRSEFFTSFDRAVLHLFPNFIEEINSLLAKKHALIPKDGMLLNTELRILALIKLGIDSSQKIASFLHYSPQTIYNYRVRLRSYSKENRNSFEATIKAKSLH